MTGFLLAVLTVRSVVTNGVEVRWFEDMVPMRDGVRLYTRGTLPPAGAKVPIILERDPYSDAKWSAANLPAEAWAVRASRDLKRGYARICQHVRGTGASEGEWVPYVDERADGLATLAWIRTLGHYNGEIFLDGTSYLSSVHWSYLATNPPDVKGACLRVQDLNRYNIHYRNGHYKAALHGNWLVGGYKKKNRSLKRDASAKFTDLPLAGFSVRRLGEYIADLEDTWRHPRPDDVWWATEGTAGGEYRRALLDSTMPVMMVTGFYDIYTEGIFDMWRELPPERRANCVLVVDDGAHGGRRAFAESDPIAWFEHCRGKGALADAKPGNVLWYEQWAGRWRKGTDLADGAGRVELPLDFGAGRFAYDPKDPPRFNSIGCLTFGGQQVQPESGWRKDVLICELDPVSEPLHVQGRMSVSLTVRTDCDDTAFYVRLSVKRADGKWMSLRDDIKSISWDNPDYRPGTPVTLAFKLSDHAFLLEKGDRLRVEVAGASAEQFIPHVNYKGDFRTQERTRVAHDEVLGGRLVLPVRADDRLLSESKQAGGCDSLRRHLIAP